MLPVCATLRFVAAPGLQSLLGGGDAGGGVAGGGVGVGVVGPGLGSSPLAQAAASTASNTIVRTPTRITDTLLIRKSATVMPEADREARCNSVDLGLTISTATDHFCESVSR